NLKILRDEFVSHRKRWEEENALSAPHVPDFEDSHSEEMHMGHLEAGTELEYTVCANTAKRVVPADDDLEAFLLREREEIEALVGLASEHSDYPEENEIIDLLSAIADKEYNTTISQPTSTAVPPQTKNLQAPAEYEEDVDIGWS
ncbi:MAG: hypothetical protein Q9214_007292, partial [Letrouitia sp. 1 TL-2023]